MRLNIIQNHIWIAFIGIGLIGIIVELYYSLYMRTGGFGGSYSFKILQYCIYVLLIFIGVKFRKKVSRFLKELILPNYELNNTNNK